MQSYSHIIHNKYLSPSLNVKRSIHRTNKPIRWSNGKSELVLNVTLRFLPSLARAYLEKSLANCSIQDIVAAAHTQDIRCKSHSAVCVKFTKPVTVCSMFHFIICSGFHGSPLIWSVSVLHYNLAWHVGVLQINKYLCIVLMLLLYPSSNFTNTDTHINSPNKFSHLLTPIS